MKKRGIRIAVFISVICVLTAAAFAAAHFTGNDYAVQVNGSPVCAEEFKLLLGEHALSNEAQRQESIRLMTSLRVEQGMAREYGLISEFTYENFLADLEDENRNRAEKLAAGEVVYGLQRFSAEQYYSYLMSNLRQELLRALPDELLGVSDERVDAYYKGLETYGGVDGETIHYTLYDVTAAQTLPIEIQNQLYSAITQTLSAGTYEEVPAVGTFYRPERQSFTPDELRNFVKQDFSGEYLLSLAENEVGGPFSLGDSIYIAQYNGFEKAKTLQDNDRAGFENTLRKEAYESLIAQKAAQADVKTNQKVMIEEEEK